MDTKTHTLDQFIEGRFKEKIPEEFERMGHRARALYHYTSIDVFEKMLHVDADFYLSESSLLNDSKEFKTGLDYLFEYAKGHRLDLCGITKMKVESWSSNPADEPWVMCFTTEHDSLGQWMAYTDRHNGGVAVGFDFDKLSASTREAYRKWRTGENGFGSLIFLVPCFYVPLESEKVNELIRFMFGPYRDRQIALNSIDDDSFRPSLTMELILILSSMIKHDSFRAEKEWRIVALPHSEEKVAKYEFLGGKPRLKSRIFGESEKLRDAIVEVFRSPHGTGTRAAWNLMKLNGRPDLVPIPSESPYNGL